MGCAELQDNCALTYSIRPELVKTLFLLQDNRRPAKAGETV